MKGPWELALSEIRACPEPSVSVAEQTAEGPVEDEAMRSRREADGFVFLAISFKIHEWTPESDSESRLNLEFLKYKT